jgi:glycogen operon protein
LGHHSTRGELARRLTGSSDYFDHDGRSPLACINLLTAHDGMTLADLTSYRHKHNLANGEGNRDGHHHNLSANAGVEGPTDDPTVQSVRAQWQRALLATLFCSQGLPQLLAGDELGQSQQGNNNAYCQDNETSWLDWSGSHPALTDFVSGLIHLRQTHAALRHARWFTGRATAGATAADIAWRRPDGAAMAASDWDDSRSRSFAGLIEVTGTAETTDAMPLRWLLLVHASDEPQIFALPPGRWHTVLDSAAGWVLPDAQWRAAPACTQAITAAPRTMLGLVQHVTNPVLPLEARA